MRPFPGRPTLSPPGTCLCFCLILTFQRASVIGAHAWAMSSSLGTPRISKPHAFQAGQSLQLFKRFCGAAHGSEDQPLVCWPNTLLSQAERSTDTGRAAHRPGNCRWLRASFARNTLGAGQSISENTEDFPVHTWPRSRAKSDAQRVSKLCSRSGSRARTRLPLGLPFAKQRLLSKPSPGLLSLLWGGSVLF